MSARTKSISKARISARGPRHGQRGEGQSIVQLEARNEQLREDVYHWRKRYFRLHEEVQKLEGLLSLRDARITELERELAKKKAYIDKLEKKLLGPTSEQGPVDSGSSAPDESESEQSPVDPATSGSTTAEPQQERVKRPRGKQPGSPGFGLRDHDALPVEEEVVCDVDEICCPDCGEQYK